MHLSLCCRPGLNCGSSSIYDTFRSSHDLIITLLGCPFPTFAQQLSLTSFITPIDLTPNDSFPSVLMPTHVHTDSFTSLARQRSSNRAMPYPMPNPSPLIDQLPTRYTPPPSRPFSSRGDVLLRSRASHPPVQPLDGFTRFVSRHPSRSCPISQLTYFDICACSFFPLNARKATYQHQPSSFPPLSSHRAPPSVLCSALPSAHAQHPRPTFSLTRSHSEISILPTAKYFSRSASPPPNDLDLRPRDGNLSPSSPFSARTGQDDQSFTFTSSSSSSMGNGSLFHFDQHPFPLSEATATKENFLDPVADHSIPFSPPSNSTLTSSTSSSFTSYHPRRYDRGSETSRMSFQAWS
jgi:hypothetical protein